MQRHPAAELDGSFINQASKTLGDRFFGAAEPVLLGRDPSHFSVCDHSGGHRFEEELTKGHAISADACTLRRLGAARMTFSTFFMLSGHSIWKQI